MNHFKKKRKQKRKPYDYSKIHITQHAIERYNQQTHQELPDEEVRKILLEKLQKANKQKYNHRTQQFICWDLDFIYYIKGGFMTTCLAPERADIWKLPFGITVDVK